MNKAYLATAVALKELNCFSIKTIDDRILLQKKIYLLQDFGMDLGYGYSWYVHGPYSPDLTAVVYKIIPEGSEGLEKYRFKDKYQDIINKVNGLEMELNGKQLMIDYKQWYELLASVAYWFKFGIKDDVSMCKKIIEFKPQFNAMQIKEAFSVYSRAKS